MTRAVDSTMPRDPAKHRYNDDLLVCATSRQDAQAEFPGVFHVLHDPELQQAFEPIDMRAARAKRCSQHAGTLAVVSAVVSLAAAAAEPLWGHWPGAWPTVVAIAAGLLGLGAVVLGGFGVLHGRQKERWLHQRLWTERLRQLHFQGFIWRIREIADSCNAADPLAHRRFIENRRRTLETFLHRLQGHVDAELSALLAPTGGAKVWLYEGGGSPPSLPPGFDPTEMFSAYRRLRFEEQVGYAEHKLRSSQFVPWLTTAPLRNQRQILRTIWTLAFGALVAWDLVLILGSVSGWQVAHGSLSHVVVVWLALLALGARTLEEGFGLSREIERYEDYRAEVFDALQRFNAARTAEEKLRVMMDMERISFDEMRSFLRTLNESSYVL